MYFPPERFPNLARAQQQELAEKDALAAAMAQALSPEGPKKYPPRRVALVHHRRKCIVCNHPQRDKIEFDYLSWRQPALIAEDFHLKDTRPLNRHAEATGLYRLRARRLAPALDRLIQQCGSVRATASSLINAIKLHAQLEGLWEEPPRRIIITRLDGSQPPAPPRPAQPTGPGDASPPDGQPANRRFRPAKNRSSNRHPCRLETTPTP
ncbi:MAG TPA: hypothetical protein VJR23_07305 [Candidatus Acidoferrales bacterium]|nr:hypothetical protein [Candidatus Acidoferrales bacterium]